MLSSTLGMSPILLTGTAHPELALNIAKHLRLKVHQAVRGRFADGEIDVALPQNVRRRHVIIIQPTAPSFINDSIIELELMIQAAKLASAGEITLVIPYFGYARQDRKDQPRVPISGSWMARKFEFAGADRFCTIDIHNEAVEGSVKVPWDNLYASYSLIPAIKKLKLANLMIVSPDVGGLRRATKYSNILNLGLEVPTANKIRDPEIKNDAKVLRLEGAVAGMDVILTDDILDTGGTLVKAAQLVMEKGAKSVRAVVTHGLFSNNALQLIDSSPLKEVLITDSVRLKEEVTKNHKIRVVSIAPLLSGAIKCIESGQSMSQKFFL